jgi:hypothetical protein
MGTGAPVAKILRNPVPTAGDVRIARSRSEPALRYLRWGAYFGLGLGLAGLSVRSLRASAERGGRASFAARMAQQGEMAVDELRSRPGVSRVTAEAGKVRDDLASKVEVAVDEAHDSVEEIYGRSYAWLGDLRRKLSPARSRR